MAQAFKFRLETLLNVRQIRQREAMRKLAAIQAELAQLDDADRRGWQEILEQQALLRETQTAGRFDPLELARIRAWIGHLRRQMHERQSMRVQVLARLEAAREQVRVARTQTRVLETLRERRFDEHRRAQQKREQDLTDELAQQMHCHALSRAAEPQAEGMDAEPAGGLAPASRRPAEQESAAC